LGASVALSLFDVLARRVVSADEGRAPLGDRAARTSAEEELALKYNLIVKLTEQPRPCSTSGNVYNPSPRSRSSLTSRGMKCGA
jgi:hypothetical protein